MKVLQKETNKSSAIILLAPLAGFTVKAREALSSDSDPISNFELLHVFADLGHIPYISFRFLVFYLLPSKAAKKKGKEREGKEAHQRSHAQELQARVALPSLR